MALSDDLAALDPALRAPIRLSIAAMADSADAVTFQFLLDVLAISKAALSKHIWALAEAEILIIDKVPAGRQVRTEVRITTAGKRALRRHRQALERIARGEH